MWHLLRCQSLTHLGLVPGLNSRPQKWLFFIPNTPHEKLQGTIVLTIFCTNHFLSITKLSVQKLSVQDKFFKISIFQDKYFTALVKSASAVAPPPHIFALTPQKKNRYF